MKFKQAVVVAVATVLALGASWAVAAGPGSAGPKLSTRIVTESDFIGGPAGGFNGVVALCAPGEVVTGGGMEVASINPAVAVVTNAPTENYDSTGLQGWVLTVSWEEPTFDARFTAFAICAPGLEVRGRR